MGILDGYDNLSQQDFLKEAANANTNANAASGNLGAGPTTKINDNGEVVDVNQDGQESQDNQGNTEKTATSIAWQAGSSDLSFNKDGSETTGLGKDTVPNDFDIAETDKEDIETEIIEKGGDEELAKQVGNVVGPAKGIEAYMANLNTEIEKERNKRKKARLLAFGLALLGGEDIAGALRVANQTPFFDDANLTLMLSQRKELMESVQDSFLIENGIKPRSRSGAQAKSNLEKQTLFLDQRYNDGLLSKDQYEAALFELNSPGLAGIEATLGKEQAKADVKAYSLDTENYGNAVEQTTQLQRLERLLSNVNTGAITGNAWVQQIKGIIKEIDPDANLGNIKDQQAIQQIASELLLSKRGELRGQGTITDNENEMLANTLPSLSNTPEANKIIIAIMKMNNKRQKEITRSWLKAPKEDKTDGYVTWKGNFIADNEDKWVKESEKTLNDILSGKSETKTALTAAEKESVKEGKYSVFSDGQIWTRTKGKLVKVER